MLFKSKPLITKGYRIYVYQLGLYILENVVYIICSLSIHRKPNIIENKLSTQLYHPFDRCGFLYCIFFQTSNIPITVISRNNVSLTVDQQSTIVERTKTLPHIPNHTLALWGKDEFRLSKFRSHIRTIFKVFKHQKLQYYM